MIGTKARVGTQQELQLIGEVLGSIDPAQPAIYSFLFASGGASASGATQCARVSPTTWR